MNTSINKWIRYQKDLLMHHLFPAKSGVCACGCERELPKRRTKWYSDECRDNSYIEYAILKGDTDMIRNQLFYRDEGFCHSCGAKADEWHADHILPVQFGGGACGLENFQTLCVDCHKEKTRDQIASHRSLISKQEALT